MKYDDLLEEMRSFNKKHDIKRKADIKRNEKGEIIKMVAMVILEPSVFRNECSIEERTYLFNNYNKALTSGDLGYSIFATCEYDNDIIRIEYLSTKYIEKVEIVSVVE